MIKINLFPIKDDLSKISNIMKISESVMKNNDLITHFPDRTMFKDYYEKVKLFIEDNFTIYIILLDIDNFKNLNDIYGHIIGDKIISETADKITSIISKKDYVCRYGEDEFIILLIEENDENIINKLMKIVETPSNNKELNGINITYSIGVAKQIDKLLSYFNLVDLADKALYNVKRKGKDNICFASDFKLIK